MSVSTNPDLREQAPDPVSPQETWAAINTRERIRELHTAKKPVFHEQGSPEWERVWAFLLADTGDAVQRCGCCHECWQYMGSWPSRDGSEITHEFRHRHNPTTGQRDNRRYVEPVNG